MRNLAKFSLLLFVLGIGSENSQADDIDPAFGKKIAEFCAKNKGKTVGDGSCTGMIKEALKEAGAKQPPAQDKSWGRAWSPRPREGCRRASANRFRWGC